MNTTTLSDGSPVTEDHREITPMSIIWHPTPEAVMSAMWSPVAEAEGLSAEDLADGELGGVDEDGNEVDPITIAQACENIRKCGCWGFVDTNTDTIHAWAADDADPSVVLHMLAHEVGHLTGEPYDDHLAEELRAETFGQVAAEAMRLYAGRLDAFRDAELARLRARVAELESVLADLVSWFPDKPEPPQWQIRAGEYGADDAIHAARAALAKETV